MDDVAIILASGFVAVMLLMTLGFVAKIIVSAIRGGGSRRSRHDETAETQLIQEIHHGLKKMEERVESLETLLMDDDRKRNEFDERLRKGM
jgi:phage shock protein B